MTSEEICVPSTNEQEEEEWSVSCSDDEKYSYNPLSRPKMPWEPPVETILNLYKKLDEKGLLQLDWICPDRRSPTPPPEERDQSQTKESDEMTKSLEPDEFDFDVVSTDRSVLTPRRVPATSGTPRQLKGSGQKRTASLQNVMSNIRRHQKLDAKDRIKQAVAADMMRPGIREGGSAQSDKPEGSGAKQQSTAAAADPYSEDF